MKIVLMAIVLLLGLQCADYDLLDDDDDRRINAVTLSVDSVADSSVTLRWTRYEDTDFYHYVVLYGTGDIVDWNDNVADSLMFDFDTVKIVKPLDDMTRYYFRVMVLNDEGLFSGSNTVDTVTDENMHGKIKLATPVKDSSGDYRLRWSRPSEPYDRFYLYADTAAEVDTTDSLFATVYSDTGETVNSGLFDGPFGVRVYAFNGDTLVAKSNSVVIKKE